MGEAPATKVNPPKPTHRAVLSKGHFRILFLRANMARAKNRSEERCLTAAVAELEDVAALEAKVGGIFNGKEFEKPDEKVEREFSDDATKGIKIAIVQGILGDGTGQVASATLAVKRDLLRASEAFGTKFRDLIEKEAKLPESEDLEDDKPLELA